MSQRNKFPSPNPFFDFCFFSVANDAKKTLPLYPVFLIPMMCILFPLARGHPWALNPSSLSQDAEKSKVEKKEKSRPTNRIPIRLSSFVTPKNTRFPKCSGRMCSECEAAVAKSRQGALVGCSVQKGKKKRKKAKRRKGKKYRAAGLSPVAPRQTAGSG